MIKIRLDVDYPYPSRLKSFILTALNIQTSKNYVKNSKIIAKMINESSKKVRAFWFFTPQTIPDGELLSLLSPLKHEVALHIARNPHVEWQRLQKATGRRVKYYTVHGTARLLARLMWRRKIWESKVPIPKEFPLKSFYDYPTLSLDWYCYHNSSTNALKTARNSIAKGDVLHIHPEWLFQRGTINHRGPYYETLKAILEVDKDLDGLAVRKKGFVKMAQFNAEGKYSTIEYERDFVPSRDFLEKLAQRGIDIFTFVDRQLYHNRVTSPTHWVKKEDNIALLKVKRYRDWWENIGRKTRNMVRKAEKNGLIIKRVEPSDKLAEGIWRIYNETPIRQSRAFPYFGISLHAVQTETLSLRHCSFLGAFFQDELVGFIHLVYGEDMAIISQILSMQKHWDKAINNALIAKTIEICEERQVQWIMYGRMGNHPSLDAFKKSNGFSKHIVARFYVPLTKKGRLATTLNLQREIKDVLPDAAIGKLIPAFEWVSAARARKRAKKSW